MPSIYLPPWRIDVERRAGVVAPLSHRAVARVAVSALEAAGAPRPASLAVILSDDRELAALNLQHMGEPGPTDVLSFPLLAPSRYPAHPGKERATEAALEFILPPGRREHLGDVVISVDRATEQAAQGRGGQTGDVSWSVAEELRLLVTHGVLHVCGWDHAREEERDAMRSLETQLLARS